MHSCTRPKTEPKQPEVNVPTQHYQNPEPALLLTLSEKSSTVRRKRHSATRLWCDHCVARPRSHTRDALQATLSVAHRSSLPSFVYMCACYSTRDSFTACRYACDKHFFFTTPNGQSCTLRSSVITASDIAVLVHLVVVSYCRNQITN